MSNCGLVIVQVDHQGHQHQHQNQHSVQQHHIQRQQDIEQTRGFCNASTMPSPHGKKSNFIILIVDINYI